MIFITLFLASLATCQDLTPKKGPFTINYTCETGIFCNETTLHCNEGFTCKWGPPGVNIGCCTKLPPKEEPEQAICGGFANQQCAEGFECKYGNTGSIGHCEPLPKCRLFANKKCDDGYYCKPDEKGYELGTCIKLTECGGPAGAECIDGYRCIYLSGSDYGHCYANP
jgi:hypothetical protein